MGAIGLHASHELYPPSELLDLVRIAQAAGFEAAMCSDHFHPWTPRQGQSGFTWSWLGAALEATHLSFGTVCAPGQRYHPAIIAQAAATLAEMYPEVTHHGRVQVEQATLYTRPERPPLLIGAAITEDTAEWVGGWADGLVTVGKESEDLRNIIRAFHNGGGQGKPMFLQSAVSYAPTDEEAISAAHQRWPVCGLEVPLLEDLRTPDAFAARVAKVNRDQVAEKLRISSYLRRHLDWLHGDFELGFERVYLHNVGGQMRRFIDVFGNRVLPNLMSVRRSA